MKNQIILICFVLCFQSVLSQNKIDTVNWKSTKEQFLSKENFFTTNSDFKWNPKMRFSLIDITFLTVPNNFLQSDIVALRTKYINFIGFTHFTESGQYLKNTFPSDLSYALTFGLRFPILCDKKYSLTLNSNFYWLSLNMVNTDIEHKGAKVKQPIFLDWQLRYEYAYSISAFVGYRNQFSDWKVTNENNNITTEFYSNKLSGLYFGLTIGLCKAFNINKGKTRWIETKRINTPNSYESFLSTYPNSIYTNESLYRLELTTYQNAQKGDIDACDNYIDKYPNGNYIKTIQNRKEDIEEHNAYTSAQNGDIKECDYYIKNFPNGKYIEQIKKLKQERIDKPENDSYQLAINGSYKDCDKYIVMFPSGKYLEKVKKIRQEKYDKAENELYNIAIKGNYLECDDYISQYSNGKYIDEIKNARQQKYIKDENEFYNLAINGSINDCENYLKKFKNEKRFIPIFHRFRKLKHEEFKKQEKIFIKLNSPSIQNIVINNEFDYSNIEFSNDILINSQNGDILTGIGMIGYSLGNLFSNEMKSTTGLPNTIIDITLFQGFKFVGKTWYTVSKDNNSYIIILSDKIVGINVRYE